MHLVGCFIRSTGSLSIISYTASPSFNTLIAWDYSISWNETLSVRFSTRFGHLLAQWLVKLEFVWKIKLFLCTPRRRMGSGGLVPLILNLGTRCGNRSDARPSLVTHGESAAIAHCTGDQVGPRHGLGSVENRNIFCSRSIGKKRLWRVQPCASLCLLLMKLIDGSGYNNVSETLALFLSVTNLKIFSVGEILICTVLLLKTQALWDVMLCCWGVVTDISKDFSAFTFMV